MDAGNKQTDAQIIARIARGDDHAFAAIVERYQGVVYACTRAITRHDHDAADAAQDAFIRLHRHLGQYDTRRPLKPYLMRIAANCARNILRKRLRQADAMEPAKLFQSVADTVDGPERQLMAGERHAAVRKMVETLPNRLREVCSLFYLADCACREIADVLHISETAVKVALHRARQKLKQSDLAEWRTL